MDWIRSVLKRDSDLEQRAPEPDTNAERAVKAPLGEIDTDNTGEDAERTFD